MITVTVNNEALADTLGVAVGSEVHVGCKNGIPLNREWRNRFKDAEIDGCITIVQNKVSKSKKGAE
jgi:hypothetical protein